MDDAVRNALINDLVIDITTTGKRTGKSSRKEIWFHNLEGVLYITGSPGRRDWYANMVANPQFTFHIKGSARADLPARATPVVDAEQRRGVFQTIKDRRQNRLRMDVEEWVAGSPLVRVEIEAT